MSCVVWLCGFVGTDGSSRALLGPAALGMEESQELGSQARGGSFPGLLVGEASFLELV